MLIAAVTADGTKLLTGSVDDSVRLWDLETQKELWRTAADNYPLHTLELSKDGASFIFVANERLELHDTKNGERRVTFEAPRVLCGGFTRDGRRVVAGTEDGFLYVFEAATGKRLQKLGAAYTGVVDALKESPDGRVFCSQGRALVTRDAKTGDELARTPAPPSGGYFTPDGRVVSFDSEAHVVRVLGPEGKLMFEEPAEKLDAPWIALSPDGKRAVFVEGEKIAALELSTRRWTGPWSSKAGPEADERVVVSNTGRALTYQRAKEAPTFIWDIEKGVKVARLDEHRLISCAAIAPDASLALLAGPDGAVSLWDLRGERPTLVDRLAGHKLDVTAIAFLSTRRAVTASLDRTLRVWDLATRTVFERLELGPVPGPVNVLEATSDGRSFLVGTENQTILRFEIGD